MNKKGMMGMMNPMKIVSILVAIVLLIVGLVPLLNQMGVIAFSLPTIPHMILNILLIMAAIVIVIDEMKMI